METSINQLPDLAILLRDLQRVANLLGEDQMADAQLTSRAGIANLTLWRNGQLLGRVRISFPIANNKAGIAGMLEVEEAFSDIEEMIQSSSPMLPGTRTFQSSLRDAPSHVALREMTEAESQGVPKERLLIIRDADGAPMPLTFVMIHRMPGPIPDRGELFDVCRERGITPSPWMLSAH